MKMTTLKVEDIIPYENNPRHNDDAVAAVAESIRQCTYVQPIITDEDHVILAGHTRLKALKLLGVEECQVIIYEGLTNDQKRKFRYLDNKTGEAAFWDLDKLEKALEELDFGDLDFFSMTIRDSLADDFTVNEPGDYTGAVEYGLEEFDDEEFRYECQECGFRFN